MTIENPERLYAFFVRGAVYAGTSRESVEASTAFGWGATPISGYVREDVAETETTAVRRERDALAKHVYVREDVARSSLAKQECANEHDRDRRR